MPTPSLNKPPDFWKQKIVAFLHDPPHKPVSIQHHEEQRSSFLNRFGLSTDDLERFEKSADWQAAAADRLIFPNPKKSGLYVDWKESFQEFRHPLGGDALRPHHFPPTAAQLESELTSALDAASLQDGDDWKHKFIAGWRLWPELAAREKNPHLAYLVADTRIPDHTLWHHNSLAAAFTSCNGNPSFLQFQIGPVQEFIAQARKTQDLWSGSYLLSYLIAQAMLAIADEIGPDCIVSPQLRGLPLADLHWSKAGFLGDLKLRDSHLSELLTPNLPNRFLALVPADCAEALAGIASQAVQAAWARIAESVHAHLGARLEDQCPDWDRHWNSQIARFPTVDWIVHPWADTTSTLKSAEDGTPPLHGGWENHPLRHAQRWAEEFIPAAERESYGPKSNPGFAWGLHYAATDWKFAARKNSRSFASWHPPGPIDLDGIPKDHLDGRNEVLGGHHHEAFWETLTKLFPRDFKGSQRYGALTVIKRLWAKTYLPEALGQDRGKPLFKPVDAIAQIDDAMDSDDAEIYYAVLAMDGDDMGQWLSGTKAAPLLNSLAGRAQEYLKEHWPGPKSGLPTADAVQRPLSPGYQAALSEALSNFSLYCAGPIVRAFSGQLIYAGGDDVLAMLPAANALDCAHALQLAFRGLHPDDPEACAPNRVKKVLKDLFHFSGQIDKHPRGFLQLRRSERADVGRASHLKPNWPLLVMGPKASVSVGIAIGHVKSPMQDTIQAARDAEKSAKAVPDKGAFSLQVLKRSGEAVGFSAKWNQNVIAVWSELEADLHDLSGRFAYRYAALVKPLVVTGGGWNGASYVQAWSDPLRDSVEAELRHVLHQQGGCKPAKARDLSRNWIDALTTALPPRDFLHFWLAWAFLNRCRNRQNPTGP